MTYKKNLKRLLIFLNEIINITNERIAYEFKIKILESIDCLDFDVEKELDKTRTEYKHYKNGYRDHSIPLFAVMMLRNYIDGIMSNEEYIIEKLKAEVCMKNIVNRYIILSLVIKTTIDKLQVNNI